MIQAIEFSLQQQNLPEFSAYLKSVQFPHRLSEQDGKMVLWVFSREHVEIARELYRRFNLLSIQGQILPLSNISLPKNSAVQIHYPATFALVILSVAGFFIVALQMLDWLSIASFQGFNVVDDQLVIASVTEVKQNLMNGEIWRLLTPAFLHFDLLHLVFNLTMTWFLGSQIEKKEGLFKFLISVVFMAMVSNIAQFYYSPDHLFGGMSGVNYGFMAYCGVVNFRHKKSCYNLPVGFFVVSVIAMLLGFFDFFSLFGYNIANWAHLAGFLAGAFAALFARNESKVVS